MTPEQHIARINDQWAHGGLRLESALSLCDYYEQLKKTVDEQVETIKKLQDEVEWLKNRNFRNT
jgi:hypothetical protein